MDPVTIGILVIIIFLISLSLGMHVGLSLLFSGFTGMVLLRGFTRALSAVATISWDSVSTFSFAVIPMFMLMGNFAVHSGITADLFSSCYKWFGRFKGGLGFVAVGTSALFNCFCGSATASAATIGTVCYPEMIRYKYKPEACAGIIASSSAYGLLIPPSIGFIIYCMMSGVSVGRMFAAGIVPSVIIIALSFILITIWAKRDPEAMPAGERFALKEKILSLKGVLGFMALFLFMLWGIFSGFFSPSEGGAVGAFGAFIIMIIRRKATFSTILRCLVDSVKTTCMIFIIMIGANYFGTLLAMTQMPRRLAQSLVSMDASSYAILWIIIGVYILLGMAVDTLPLIAILTPIFWPIVEAMHWDPVWFGVITVMCMLIGLITPPDGIPCYIMSGIAGVPLMRVFKACVPFFIMLVIVLILIIYIEPISTWLPGFLGV